ncbi:MAG: hypothetical protein RSD80_05535, partial [Raoultibacter sp.]
KGRKLLACHCRTRGTSGKAFAAEGLNFCWGVSRSFPEIADKFLSVWLIGFLQDLMHMHLDGAYGKVHRRGDILVVFAQ